VAGFFAKLFSNIIDTDNAKKLWKMIRDAGDYL
jgi:hypothetical protein